jgi:hypothetical protein
MKISNYITTIDASRSATAKRLGIDNTPDNIAIIAMQLLCKKIYDPICFEFNQVVNFKSFFRSVKLNKAIGGSATSQHCTGNAIDLDDNEIENIKLFNFIKDNLVFDQLIWEYGTSSYPDWVHVSYKSTGNRNQILISYKEKGKTKYKPYLIS